MLHLQLTHTKLVHRTQKIVVIKNKPILITKIESPNTENLKEKKNVYSAFV